MGDESILRGDVDQLIRRSLPAKPGVGIGSRHLRQRSKEFSGLAQVVIEGKFQVSPSRHIEHRKGQVSLEDFVSEFRGMKGVL